MERIFEYKKTDIKEGEQQNQSAEYVHAHSLFNELKRRNSEDGQRVNLSVDSLLEIDKSFMGKDIFHEERVWINEVISKKIDSLPAEDKVKIINHLALENKDLAKQIFEHVSEEISKFYKQIEYERTQGGSKYVSDRARTLWGMISEAATNIGGRNYVLQWEDKLGFENSLESDLKGTKLRILHLEAPKVEDFEKVSAEQQWRKLQDFFQETEYPLQFLGGWHGTGITARENFIADRINEAIITGVEISKKMPSPARCLSELIEKSASFKFDIKAILEGVDDSRTITQANNIRKNTDTHTDGAMMSVGVERRIPDIVTSQAVKVLRMLEPLKEKNDQLIDKNTIVNDDEGKYRRSALRDSEDVQQFDEIFSQVVVLANQDPAYQGILDLLQKNYKELLLDQIYPARGKTAAIIENRTDLFCDPYINWDEAINVLIQMNQVNEYKNRKSDSNNKEDIYDASKINIQKYVDTLKDLSDVERGERKAFLYENFGKKENGFSKEFEKCFFEAGMFEDAARFVCLSNNFELISKLVLTNDPSVSGILSESKDLDYDKWVSYYTPKEFKSLEQLDAVLTFFKSKLSRSVDIDSKYAQSFLNTMGRAKLIQGMLLKNEEKKENILGKGGLDLCEENISYYSEKVWELWQQGVFVRGEDVDTALKFLIVDGRDETIIALALSQNDKIKIPFARAEVMKENGDIDGLQKCISQLKQFPQYQNDRNIRQKADQLEKNVSELLVKNQINSMSARELSDYVKKDTYSKQRVIELLQENGRYHEMLTLFGNELKSEQLEKMVVSILYKGDFASVEELLTFPLLQSVPNRNKFALAAKCLQLGFDVEYFKNNNFNEINQDYLFNELVSVFKKDNLNAQEIYYRLQETFSGTETALLLKRYAQLVSDEDFLTLDSISSSHLKDKVVNELFSQGKLEEAHRFVVLQKDEALLAEYMSKCSENGISIVEYFGNIKDLKIANKLVEDLIASNHKDVARELVKQFVEGYPDLNGYLEKSRKYNSEKDDIIAVEMMQLISKTGSLHSLMLVTERMEFIGKGNAGDYLRSSIECMWNGVADMETTVRDMENFLRGLEEGGRKKYIDKFCEFSKRKESLSRIGVLVSAVEAIYSKEEGIKRFESVYASYLAMSVKNLEIEDFKSMESSEKVNKITEKYLSNSSPEEVFFAVDVMTQQEWGQFMKNVPASEKDTVQLLADWYRSKHIYNEKDASPIVGRSINRIAEALKERDYQTLNSSLETLLGLETTDAGTRLSKIMKDHIEQGGNIGGTYRICKALSKMENFKANTMLADLVKREETPEILSRYIMRLLVENEHFDEHLRNYFAEKAAEGDNEKGYPKKSVNQFRKLMRDTGINPDASIMRYVESRDMNTIEEGIKTNENATKTFSRDGKYQEQADWLLEDVNTRLLYFLKQGGRSSFSLINDYNFNKFSHLLKLGTELELHPEPVKNFEDAIASKHELNATKRIIENIEKGKFPFSIENKEEAWKFSVDINKESQIKQARLVAGSSLGKNELGNFVKAIIYSNRIKSLPDSEKEKTTAILEGAGQNMASLDAFVRGYEEIFGEDIQENEMPRVISKTSSTELPLNMALQYEVVDIQANTFEPSLASLGKRMMNETRQLYRDNKISKEERDRLLQEYEQPENVLPAILSRELPSNFAPAVEEWRNHIQGALQIAREAKALQRGASQSRELQVRFLDKTQSMPEYLRFADAAQCCFTSKNFSQGIGPQQYISRIWKDPMSFVFHIEEPNETENDRRNVVGFVFGSYGTNKQNEPVILLNGVYMDKKTDLAARKVIEVIENNFAKELGCVEILVASQHGGKTIYGEGFSNTEDEYLRLRAIKDRRSDEPEKSTYDDIALVAVDAKEGRQQDRAVVNRWGKAGNHVFRKMVDIK